MADDKLYDAQENLVRETAEILPPVGRGNSISRDPFEGRNQPVGLDGKPIFTPDGEPAVDPRGAFVYVDGELWFGDTIHPRILTHILKERGERTQDWRQFIEDHEMAFGRFFATNEFLWYMGNEQQFWTDRPKAWFASGDYGGTDASIIPRVMEALQQFIPGIELEED